MKRKNLYIFIFISVPLYIASVVIHEWGGGDDPCTAARKNHAPFFVSSVWCLVVATTAATNNSWWPRNAHRLSQRLRTFIFCWRQYNGNLWYFVWLSSFKQQLFVLRTLFWIFQEWIKYIDYEILITLCIFYLNWNCLEKSWVWSSLSIFVFVTNPSQQKMKRRRNQSRKMQQHASSRSELCCSAAAAAAAANEASQKKPGLLVERIPAAS